MLKVTLGAGLAQWVRRPPHAAWQESRKGDGATRSKGLQIEVRPTPLYPVYLHLLCNKGNKPKNNKKKRRTLPLYTAFNSVEIFNQSLNNRFFKKGRKKPHLMWRERGELRRSINHDGGRGCR